MEERLLPEFNSPPVVEVVVSVQFDEPAISGPMLMLRWSQIRNRFPKYEEAPPIPLTIESFDGPRDPGFEFQISDVLPIPRFFMKDESETEILQVQENMFGYGWRKLGPTDDYPRYEKIISNFERELVAFQKFLSEEGLGDISPVQCEVTYVNLILPGEVWRSHSELGKIIPSVAPSLTENFLPLPEQSRYLTQYVILSDNGLPQGRLYVSVEPGYLSGDSVPMYLMKLTARGTPGGTCNENVISAMDVWHEWIVRGFTTLTSPGMHEEWRRTI